MKELHLEVVRMEEREGVTSKQAYYRLRDSFGYSDKSHSVYRHWKFKNNISTIKYFKCRVCSIVHERFAPNTVKCESCIENNKWCPITQWNASRYPVYSAWYGMWSRCTDPRSKAWGNYGKRGIRVCKDWQDYYVFGEWCMKNGWEEGLEIDRIDVNGNYCPENCRIVERWVNAANKRKRFNKTGYTGVYKTSPNRYRTNIRNKGKEIYLGCFKSKKEAATVRDKYILENGLPNTLNILSRS